MPFQMTIFGPATAPAITIGGNRYKLTTDIPSGAFAPIVGLAGRKSVTPTFSPRPNAATDWTAETTSSNPYRPATAPSNGGDSAST